MKRIALLVTFLLVFLFPSYAFAQTFNNNEQASLPANQTVTGDYFAAGDTVRVSGTVNGDVYAAGGTIIIDGRVNGDVLAAGGNVTISGTVSDDVRVAGGNVTISGDIGKNLTIGTGNGTITSDAQITGSVVGGAGNLTIMAPVGKNAVIGGGTVILGNVIQGNVTAGVGNLTLNETASVSGNLTYTSEEEAVLEPGASISGQVTRHQLPTKVKEDSQRAELAGKFAWETITFLMSLIFGFLLLLMAPNFFKSTTKTAQDKPLLSFGLGLITFLLSPMIIVILLITVIGIPFALIWLFIFIVDLAIAKLFIAYLIGERVHTALNLKSNQYLIFLTGLLVYKIVTFIPIAGALIAMVSTLIGFGALLIQKRVTFTSLRDKNEI